MKVIPINNGQAILNGGDLTLYRNFENTRNGHKVTHNFNLSAAELMAIIEQVDIKTVRHDVNHKDDLPF